jgi:hypothetical protein
MFRLAGWVKGFSSPDWPLNFLDSLTIAVK